MQKQKPQCKYGDKCYRKNPQHFIEYSHGSQNESEVKIAIVGSMISVGGLGTNNYVISVQ